MTYPDISFLWRNPSPQEFAVARSVLRGLLTQGDLYVWQNINLSHSEFERTTAINGIRLILRQDRIGVHHETVAVPEYFPWVFSDREQTEAMDIENRREAVTKYLKTHTQLTRVYPIGFDVIWYA